MVPDSRRSCLVWDFGPLGKSLVVRMVGKSRRKVGVGDSIGPYDRNTDESQDSGVETMTHSP